MGKKHNQVRLDSLEKSIENYNTKPKFLFKERSFKFTENQTQILTTILDDRNKIIIIEGPSGTGKSYISIYAALTEFLKSGSDIESILYLRTVVESASKSMGHLPGNIEEKNSPFRQILDSKIEEMIEERDQKFLLNSPFLDAAPINFIRGSNWAGKLIIADEIQNYSVDEIKTLMTRLGEGSKLVMCGDSQQKDIKNSGINTLKEIFDNPESEDAGIKFFQLTSKDIVRSEIVKFIVEKFENHYKEKAKKPIFHQQKTSEEWSPSKIN